MKILKIFFCKFIILWYCCLKDNIILLLNISHVISAIIFHPVNGTIESAHAELKVWNLETMWQKFIVVQWWTTCVRWRVLWYASNLKKFVHLFPFICSEDPALFLPARGVARRIYAPSWEFWGATRARFMSFC